MLPSPWVRFDADSPLAFALRLPTNVHSQDPGLVYSSIYLLHNEFIFETGCLISTFRISPSYLSISYLKCAPLFRSWFYLGPSNTARGSNKWINPYLLTLLCCILPSPSSSLLQLRVFIFICCFECPHSSMCYIDLRFLCSPLCFQSSSVTPVQSSPPSLLSMHHHQLEGPDPGLWGWWFNWFISVALVYLVGVLSRELACVPGLSGIVARYLSNSSLKASTWDFSGSTVSSSSRSSGGRELNNLGPIQKIVYLPFFRSFFGFHVNFWLLH